MRDLEAWLEKNTIDDSWQSVENILEWYEVPTVDIDNLDCAHANQKYATYQEIFGNRTRIIQPLTGQVEIESHDHWHVALDRVYQIRRYKVGDLCVQAYRLALTLSNRYTLRSIAENRLSNGSKLLRFLLKNEVPEELRTEFELIWSLALSQFKTAGCFLVWSIDPLDLLTISEASFSSCHSLKPDSCHRGGSINYMTDSATSVIYTTNKLMSRYDEQFPQKLWRSLVYYNPEEGLTMQREYPYTRKGYYEAAVNMVMSHLKANHNQIYEVYSADIKQYNYAVYVDRPAWCLSFIDEDTIPTIYVGDGICPVCGYPMDKAEFLYCCPIQCHRCDSPLDPSEVHIGADDYPYCDSCFDALFDRCTQCGDVEYIDDMYHDRYADAYYCPVCWRDDAITCTCDVCGDDFVRDHAMTINGRTMCPDCYDFDVKHCYICGTPGLFSEGDFRKDNIWRRYYCRECWEKTAQTCDACGNMYTTGRTVGDKNYCLLCYEELADKQAIR